MPDPDFLVQTADDIYRQAQEDYLVLVPTADVEEGSTQAVEAEVLAQNVKGLQWRQARILAESFDGTASMPNLILRAADSGVVWNPGSRASGWVKVTRDTGAPNVDYTLPAGTMLVTAADAAGKLIRATTTADALLKAGESYCLAPAEVVEVQADELQTWSRTVAGGGETLVASQLAGSGVKGNLADSTLNAFEAAPPAGFSAIANVSPSRVVSDANASSLFTIAAAVNDQLAVTVDGAPATITLAAGISLSGAAVAADIQAKLRAVGGGGFAQAYCRFSALGNNRFYIFSGTPGAGSSISLSASAHDVRATLGLSNVLPHAGGTGFTGGLPPQTRTSLLMEVRQKKAAGGQIGLSADYAFWAKNSGEAVDDAKVIPVLGGMWVYPISSSGALFSQTQLDNITAYIETKCPAHLMNNISVVNITLVPLYISATLTLAEGFALADVSPAVKAVITGYIKSSPVGDSVIPSLVRIQQIGKAIMAVSGVIDYAALTLDTVSPPVSTANITLGVAAAATINDAGITLA